MIRLTSQTKVLLAMKPVDFRKQIDGLVAFCKRDLQSDPRSGSYFVFINKSRTQVRVLSYDGSGYWLCSKRISKGKFEAWPQGDADLSSVDAKQLMQIIKATLCSSAPIAVA